MIPLKPLRTNATVHRALMGTNARISFSIVMPPCRLKARLEFRLEALELGSKRLSNPFHVRFPLVMITGDLSIGKGLA